MNHFRIIIISIVAILAASVSCSDNKKNEDEGDPSSASVDSIYVSNLFDYQYAPGQHIALLKSCPPDSIVGSNRHNILLGGWGGYIVAGFNHDIINEVGPDFIVTCGTSVSPEPGVIYVMEDENGNGLPDEQWYEIRGSEYGKADCICNYQLTYYAPCRDSSGLVTWHDNKGNSGTLSNSSNWWWKSGMDSVTFSGTRLPDAYYNSPQADGSQYWSVYPDLFKYGYAENGGSPERTSETGNIAIDFDAEYKGNIIEIDSAMDADGKLVNLRSIRFVKVQTGIFQQAGWLGEISTEITGIADLRKLKKYSKD